LIFIFERERERERKRKKEELVTSNITSLFLTYPKRQTDLKEIMEIPREKMVEKSLQQQDVPLLVG
jgi:hypothetical protein